MMAVRAGIGIAAGAELLGAHLPGHRWLRLAGQVIVWLLLTGLAAAVVWVLLVVALAGGLGPHFPGPRRTRSRAQPGPGTAGKLTRPVAVAAGPCVDTSPPPVNQAKGQQADKERPVRPR